jgi:hypothetical protein
VKSNERSIRKAAEQYGVKKSTLGDQVSGKITTSNKIGRKTIFPIEVEKQLVAKAQSVAEQGFGISRKQLICKAGCLAKTMKLKTPFKGGVPGQAWLDGFFARNNELVLRKPEKLSNIRARNLNPITLQKYFADLGTILTDLNLKNASNRIWNMDETGIPMEHSPSNVCIRKGTRSIPGRVSNSRESVTIVVCVNASGGTMPSQIIVKGKTEKALNGFNKAEGPKNAIWTYQQKAWINDEGCVKLLRKFFLKNCGNARPQFLIVDQNVSDEAIDLLEEACKEDIHLFALPPHTTHALCPLDKAVFGPLKKHYNVACSEFMSVSPGNIVMKWTWPNLFSKAYAYVLTINNIKQGIKTCGIFPFDPTIIPHQFTLTSNPSDNGNNAATCTPDDNDIRTAQTHTATCPSANDHTESKQNTTENAKSDSAVIVMPAYDGVNPDVNLELLSQIALDGWYTELEE